ncbi:MBL fold metallo-hydrolase [Thermogemmatispora sp.]|uniref:MBL fold metallo-hydrolase n=1 Tax=Thermogemmatispora sp. TaxID=1968838 RepID=UPI0035E3F79C
MSDDKKHATTGERPKHPAELTPGAEEVVSGVWKITLPIPFPLRTVNIYALVGRDGWALVDAAMGTPEARAVLAEGLERAGLRLQELRALVLSHHHPDHIGLSAELQEQSGATVYMHPIDAAIMQAMWHGGHGEQGGHSAQQRSFTQANQFFRPHGMPPLEPVVSSQLPPEVVNFVIRVPTREAITCVEDGEEITLVGERYRVIWTPGHSDGHIVLFRERDGLLLAADHVLPRITPNIGLYSEYNRANPLGDYIQSLEKVRHLPASLVLPGHGEPFRNLARRVRELIRHHAQRELEILSLLGRRPQHAYQLAEQVFGQRLKSDEARRMAVAEILSHLEHLRLAGYVRQERTDDGLILYAAV